MFGDLHVVFMVKRFIKMGMKLLDLEFLVISVIRHPKMPEFAKLCADYAKKSNEPVKFESVFKVPRDSTIQKIKISQFSLEEDINTSLSSGWKLYCNQWNPDDVVVFNGDMGECLRDHPLDSHNKSFFHQEKQRKFTMGVNSDFATLVK
jgi:hypothetical protein